MATAIFLYVPYVEPKAAFQKFSIELHATGIHTPILFLQRIAVAEINEYQT